MTKKELTREEIDQRHIDYIKSVELKNYPTNPNVPMPSEFVNDAGKIANLFYGKLDSVALIESKAGSTRSNHRHPDVHYLYLISGECDYYERDLEQDGKDIKPVRYTAGQMIFTAPWKVHKTCFITDCVMLSLNNSTRTHENHEKTLERVEF